MYIQTDNDNNITRLISVGGLPTENGYEIDETTVDRDILDHIFEYKYIDGEFIKNENYRDSKVDTIRDVKISNMSLICNALITSGIDYNGEHYSLSQNDQINLMKLESIAVTSPETPLFYHADEQICRLYTAEEIINIASLATQWITINTTYFNLLKSQLNDINTVDEVLAIQYGIPLKPELQVVLDSIISNVPSLTIPIITEDFDYSIYFPKPDIDSLVNSKKLYDEQNREEIIEDTVEENEDSIQEGDVIDETENTQDIEYNN